MKLPFLIMIHAGNDNFFPFKTKMGNMFLGDFFQKLAL